MLKPRTEMASFQSMKQFLSQYLIGMKISFSSEVGIHLCWWVCKPHFQIASSTGFWPGSVSGKVEEGRRNRGLRVALSASGASWQQCLNSVVKAILLIPPFSYVLLSRSPSLASGLCNITLDLYFFNPKRGSNFLLCWPLGSSPSLVWLLIPSTTFIINSCIKFFPSI